MIPHMIPIAFVLIDRRFQWILFRILSDKRRRSLSQADLYHVVLSSSTDIALCEFFARLASRLRAIPALFAVVEEAEQPIEICDETRTVQYVNRAYESLTGCIRIIDQDFPTFASCPVEWYRLALLSVSLAVNFRNEVLGTKSSDTRRKSLHSCVPRPKDVDGEGGMRRLSTEWHCIQVPGSSARFVPAHSLKFADVG
ncbi:unnamed protein product [Toxocara canis]|uniref:PAS domain-containing protein n=1 Tax=Toxocara canis TaxID=6265 RepID=A0A183UF41_TOXCA|nr:unnamed protein product [Toxocara canis]